MSDKNAIAEEETRYVHKHRQEEKNTPCVDCASWNKVSPLHGLCELTGILGRKEQIEADSGLEFVWKELPGKKSSRIVMAKQNVSFADRSQWDAQFEWIEQTMVRMKDAFKKHLASYRPDE